MSDAAKGGSRRPLTRAGTPEKGRKAMVPIEKSLKDLSMLAAQLNAESDAVNATIERVEASINAARVGVEVWQTISSDPLKPPPLLAETTVQARRGDACIAAWQLGYAKLADGWHLVVRKVERHSGIIEDEPWCETDPVGEPVPLKSAPRNVRIEALPQLEPLIEEIKAKVTEYIGNIHRSRSLAAD